MLARVFTVAAMSAALAAVGGEVALAAPTQDVTANGQKGWLCRVTSADGACEFVTGPDNANLLFGGRGAPVGAGSVRLFTGTHGDESAQFRNDRYAGKKLADLKTLTYWTYVTQNNGQQWPYLSLVLDTDGDGVADDQLFFEPPYQTPLTGSPSLPNQGPTVMKTWQGWDARAGGWWANSGACGANPGLGGVKSIDEYLVCEPNAKIVNAPGTNIHHPLGGVRLNVGFASESDVFDGNVDSFRIGFNGHSAADQYDFDPAG